MTERVAQAIHVVCKDKTVKTLLLEKKLSNLSLQLKPSEQTNREAINVLIVCSCEQLANCDYTPFDIVMVIGDSCSFKKPEQRPHIIYFPNRKACVNFFLFVYMSYNSDHLVGYDLFSDLLPVANCVLRDVYSCCYSDLVTFIREWGNELSSEQVLVLVSQDYDCKQSFSFVTKIDEVCSECVRNDAQLLVAENYNAAVSQKYYQGFIMQVVR